MTNPTDTAATTRDGQPLAPGMLVTVCHVPTYDFYAGLFHEATVAEVRPNGIVLTTGGRVGARSLFSTVGALASFVEQGEALAAADDAMLRNAR